MGATAFRNVSRTPMSNAIKKKSRTSTERLLEVFGVLHRFQLNLSESHV
jgi:hypothetical protein